MFAFLHTDKNKDSIMLMVDIVHGMLVRNIYTYTLRDFLLDLPYMMHLV